MKVKVLMATLVITLLMGVRGYANPCDAVCDPCGACDQCATVRGDLFSGLRKLVNGVRASHCSPCDAVVACNPCDGVASCDPCEAVCDTPRFALGSRLRSLFASPSCTPCDFVSDCGPCDEVTCDPCGLDACGPRFSLRGLNPFRNISFGRSCVTDCGPCDGVSDCAPCDFAACGPCDDACGNDYCGPRGHLIDLPRISLSKLFGGLRGCSDDGICNPCDNACFR